MTPTRVERVTHERGRVTGAELQARNEHGSTVELTVRARAVVMRGLI